MRGLTTTIILVLVLAGLGGYIYFVESERPAGGVEEREKVFAVEADAIEEVTVTAEGQTTTLRKTDGTWQITAPVAVEADSTEVTSLTSALAALDISRVVAENASNLAEYGLAEPRIKISYKAAGGTGGELHIGEKTPTQGDMYALEPGTTRVFLVPAYQETALAKSTFDLRDKQVLHFERDKVDTIEISQPGQPTIQLARAGTEWQLKEPIQVRGDYSTVEGLLTRLDTAAASEIADPNSPASFGLEQPTAVVTLGAGSTRATLEVGTEQEGTLYARDTGRGLIFKVEPSLAVDLKKTVDEVRDKDLFEFRTYNVDRLRITRGSETYEFQKVAGGGENGADKWQRIVDGQTTDVDLSKMEDLASKLSALRAQSFNQTTNAAGQDPTLVVAASYDGGKFERVRIISGENDAFGVREGEPGVAVLDADNVKGTITALEAVLNPAPAPAP